MKQRYFTLVLVFCFGLTTSAQKDSTRSNKLYFWGSAGATLPMSENTKNPLGYKLAFTFRFKQVHCISFAYQKNSVFNTSNTRYFNKFSNSENASVLYGLCTYQQKNLALIFSSGLNFSITEYKRNPLRYENYGGLLAFKAPVFDHNYFNYIGLPVNLKILSCTPYMGIEFDLYANIRKHSDYGFVVSYAIGKIRSK